MRNIAYPEPATGGLVSVIIPTRNGEQYIGVALASVAHQWHAQWEVIVVEDATQGATEQIVRDFARKCPKHRVDYSRNERSSGASYTRNVAFARARGEFVALLDCDDRWFPDHLSTAVHALRATGKDIAYSTVAMIDDVSGLPIGNWGPDPRELAGFPNGLFLRNFITPSATVMRRQVLADVGEWDTQYRFCEDADYWFRCVAARQKFHHIEGCHCLYRAGHAGATGQKNCATQEVFADIAERYLDAPFMSSPEIFRGVCRKHVCAALLRAAESHAAADPSLDPSADASRSAALMLRAWRLRRKRVGYLWRGAMYGASNLLRRRLKDDATATRNSDDAPPSKAAA